MAEKMKSISEARQNLPTLSQTAQKLYVRWAYKQDPTFDNSGIKKYLRFQGPGYNGIFGTMISAGDQLSPILEYDAIRGLDGDPLVEDRRVDVPAVLEPARRAVDLLAYLQIRDRLVPAVGE